MTVCELIEKLQQEDPNRLVVCQKDREGNGYSPLQTWWIGACRPKILGRLEAGLEKLTAADRKAGFTKEDVVRNGIPALFLVPAG
jgi:hypothetical protein